MTHDQDFFTPEQVDEQVDQLQQARKPLSDDLKGYYLVEREEDNASLEHAWKRISASLSGNREHSYSKTKAMPIHTSKVPHERIRMIHNQVPGASRRTNIARRLNVLVAVLVAALLVGGLITVLNLSRHISTTGAPGATKTTTGHTPTATSAPAAVPGKTLYTTPPNQWGFESLSWSPDSKRIASATVDPKGVQIWDAATGDHLVTVSLPVDNSEWAYGLAWSPNSREVAVATNKRLLIVDGETGAIISSRSANVPLAYSATTTGQAYNAMLIPASGGFGFRSVTWSLDGKRIAFALSYGPYGEIQVLNLQSGAIEFTLKLGSSDNFGSLAWSSDGQYIAASSWNTQGVDPTQPDSKVAVWNVSSQQLVFQHTDFMDSGGTVAWQPQSHNLAFVGETTFGGNQISTIKIWNALSGKLVKQLIGAGTDALAWSPGGDKLAYANFGNEVVIVDVATGKQVYVYHGDQLSVSVVSWSPDGKYIASGEGNTQGQMVAKVWTA